MAITAPEQRRSAAVVGVPLPPGVTPDSRKRVGWRRSAGWGYFGAPYPALVPIHRMSVVVLVADASIQRVTRDVVPHHYDVVLE